MIIKDNKLILNENDIYNMLVPIEIYIKSNGNSDINVSDMIQFIRDGFSETKWIKGLADAKYEVVQIDSHIFT